MLIMSSLAPVFHGSEAVGEHPVDGTTLCPACGKVLKILTIYHHAKITCPHRDLITPRQHDTIAALYRQAMRLYMRRRSSAQLRRGMIRSRMNTSEGPRSIAKQSSRKLPESSTFHSPQSRARSCASSQRRSSCDTQELPLPKPSLSIVHVDSNFKAAADSPKPQGVEWLSMSTSMIAASVRAHALRNPITISIPSWLSNFSCDITSATPSDDRVQRRDLTGSRMSEDGFTK
jgi:hypothetical protein